MDFWRSQTKKKAKKSLSMAPQRYIPLLEAYRRLGKEQKCKMKGGLSNAKWLNIAHYQGLCRFHPRLCSYCLFQCRLVQSKNHLNEQLARVVHQRRERGGKKEDDWRKKGAQTLRTWCTKVFNQESLLLKQIFYALFFLFLHS